MDGTFDSITTSWSPGYEPNSGYPQLRSPPPNSPYNEPYPLPQNPRKRGPVTISTPVSYSASPTELPSSPSSAFADQPLCKKFKFSENFLPTLIEKMSVEPTKVRRKECMEETLFSTLDTEAETTFKSKYLTRPLPKIEEIAFEKSTSSGLEIDVDDSSLDEDIFAEPQAGSPRLKVNVSLPRPDYLSVESRLFKTQVKQSLQYTDPRKQLVLYSGPKYTSNDIRRRINAIGGEDDDALESQSANDPDAMDD